MEIGLTYCGDPDAVYRWDVETQERVFGWWRAKHAPAASKRGPSRAQGTAEALARWGLT